MAQRALVPAVRRSRLVCLSLRPVVLRTKGALGGGGLGVYSVRPTFFGAAMGSYDLIRSIIDLSINLMR